MIIQPEDPWQLRLHQNAQDLPASQPLPGTTARMDGERKPLAARSEAEGAGRRVEHTPCGTFLLDDVDLVRVDILRAGEFGRFAEVLGEFGDVSDVLLPGVNREVAHPHVFDHSLT